MTATTADRRDLVVVGAGILGLAVAREWRLRDSGARITVLERETEVAGHQTGHNSGVVHAGIYYKPGSLKAQLCVSGARELYEYCDEHSVAYRRSGKLVVALDASELPALDELERRGQANGVPGLRRVDARGLAEIEPACRGHAALHSPETGVVDYAAVARAMAAELSELEVEVVTGCEVESVSAQGGATVVEHDRGRITAGRTVCCAGAWSDRLAVTAGADPDPRIVPFRGAYLNLRPERAELVRSMIYPVPDPGLPFLGVHLTRHIGNEVSIGPTALLSPGRSAYRLRDGSLKDLRETLAWPGTWRMARRWWRTGLTEMSHVVSRAALARAAAQYVPELRRGDLEPAFAGIRAQALRRDGGLEDDFVMSETEGALHVRNAPSPAATSSLALARLIVDRAQA